MVSRGGFRTKEKRKSLMLSLVFVALVVLVSALIHRFEGGPIVGERIEGGASTSTLAATTSTTSLECDAYVCENITSSTSTLPSRCCEVVCQRETAYGTQNATACYNPSDPWCSCELAGMGTGEDACLGQCGSQWHCAGTSDPEEGVCTEKSGPPLCGECESGTTTTTIDCEYDIEFEVDSDYNRWLDENHPDQNHELIQFCDLVWCKATISGDYEDLAGLSGTLSIIPSTGEGSTINTECTVDEFGGVCEPSVGATLPALYDDLDFTPFFTCEFSGSSDACDDISGESNFIWPSDCISGDGKIIYSSCMAERAMNDAAQIKEPFHEICEPHNPVLKTICTDVFTPQSGYTTRLQVANGLYDSAVLAIYTAVRARKGPYRFPIAYNSKTTSAVLQGSEACCRHWVGAMISLVRTIRMPEDRFREYSYATNVKNNLYHTVLMYKTDPTRNSWLFLDPTNNLFGFVNQESTWTQGFGPLSNQCAFGDLSHADIPVQIKSCHNISTFCPYKRVTTALCWRRWPAGDCFTRGVTDHKYCKTGGSFVNDCRGPNAIVDETDCCETSYTCTADGTRCGCIPGECLDKYPPGVTAYLCDSDGRSQTEGCEGFDGSIGTGDDCCEIGAECVDADGTCGCNPNTCFSRYQLGETGFMCSADGLQKIQDCRGPDGVAGNGDDCCIVGLKCLADGKTCGCAPNTCVLYGVSSITPGSMCSVSGTIIYDNCKGPDGVAGNADDCCTTGLKCSTDGVTCVDQTPVE